MEYLLASGWQTQVASARRALNSVPGKRFHEQQAAAKAAALLASQQAAAVALGFDPKALARLAEFRPDHFFKADAMLASVESGAVAAVRGSYLVALRRKGGRLQRRQDMPPEAFWTAADLRATAEALGPMFGLLFVVLSYRWLSKVRPPNARTRLASLPPAADRLGV